MSVTQLGFSGRRFDTAMIKVDKSALVLFFFEFGKFNSIKQSQKKNPDH